MKHLVLFSILISGFLAAMPCSSFATASAVATPTQATTSLTAGVDKQGGFLQKTIAKRIVKKAKKAFGSIGDDNGNVVAILAYLSTIGFLVALVLHFTGSKTSLGAFHLGQVTGIFLLSLVASVSFILLSIVPVVGWAIMGLVAILFLINWLSGLIHALKGEEKPVPILGKQFDKAFRKYYE